MILLDTCVVSEAIRPVPSPNVLAWIDSLPEVRVFLSSLVIGELQKRSALLIWLEQLRERFRDRILPFDEETALRWGMLTADLEKAGRPVPVVGGMLAATALQYSALLATRNISDYEGTGVECVDPWQG